LIVLTDPSDMEPGGDDSAIMPIHDRGDADIDEGRQFLGFQKLLHVRYCDG